MGRLIDAVLAVSALAIASAVAWADWVMSCCGIGSEAMSQVLGGQVLIMVRMEIQGEERGMIQKWLYLGNHQSDLLQNLKQCSWGCALPLDGIISVAMTSWGTYRCAKCIPDAFSGKKQGKIQPGVCSLVFPGCPVSRITVIQCFPSFLRETMFKRS